MLDKRFTRQCSGEALAVWSVRLTDLQGNGRPQEYDDGQSLGEHRPSPIVAARFLKSDAVGIRERGTIQRRQFRL